MPVGTFSDQVSPSSEYCMVPPSAVPAVTSSWAFPLYVGLVALGALVTVAAGFSETVSVPLTYSMS